MNTLLDDPLERYVTESALTWQHVTRMVESEALELAEEIRPRQLIRFWGGGESHVTLHAQAGFLGGEIFALMNPGVSEQLGIARLTVQALNQLRASYGDVHTINLALYYATESRGATGARLESAGLDVVTARIGKKATSHALTLYQYGMPEFDLAASL